MPFTDEAARELRRWRVRTRALEKAASGLFQSWLGKLNGLAIRIALVLEYLWWIGRQSEAPPPIDNWPKEPPPPPPAEISALAFRAAVAFLETYAVPMARRTFGDAAVPESERDTAVLARWIKSQEPIPSLVNGRALRREHAALPTRDARRYAAALAELAEAGWLRPAPSRAGNSIGRRRDDWEVNPALRVPT